MAVNISPLELLLDDENPRFVVLGKREQADIRKYLVTYEDVCDLAVAINNYGGILPGERIVALKQGDHYVVIEGNRRTCSLQLLLNAELIPAGFQHRIPTASDQLKATCQTIEVDIVPDRETALELMTKRHIEGVKQWKPLAKKQFFASNYAAGRSVADLSRITGIRESAIKSDIRDYKLFLSAYQGYRNSHPEYNESIIDLSIDPFIRIFKVKFNYNGGIVKPIDVLKIHYTEQFDAVSDLPEDTFRQIIQNVFEETTVTRKINTRDTLENVTGVMTAIDSAVRPVPLCPPASVGTVSGGTASGGTVPEGTVSGGTVSRGTVPGGSTSGRPASEGSASGGPAPRIFFEALNWRKISRDNQEHEGLLIAVNELYYLSVTSCGRKKAYEVFPVATGMVLRTAYEQVLKLRLRATGLWGDFMKTVPAKSFPTLAAMEKFIDNGERKNKMLPNASMKTALDLIIGCKHREFLNANVHNPGDIRVSAESLSAIAQGGMFTLIQESINLL